MENKIIHTSSEIRASTSWVRSFNLSKKSGPCIPILNHVNPIHPLTYYPDIYFNIILSTMPKYSEWCPPFRLCNQHFVCIYFPRARYMHRPALWPWFDHPNNISWRPQIMKVFTAWSSPAARTSPPPWSKAPCSFSDALYLHCSFNVRDQVSRSYITKGKTAMTYILIFTFFDSTQEGKKFWNAIHLLQWKTFSSSQVKEFKSTEGMHNASKLICEMG